MDTITNTSNIKRRKIDKGGNIVHRETNIIDLPEPMIHHITSSLSLRDMAYMSVSLKRWRYLCYTTPYITIDIGVIERRNLSFLKFVDRMFILHLNNLQRLTISCATGPSCGFVDEYVVETWILKAIECSVQELDLNIPTKDWLNPRGIFTLPSLRILKLNLNNAFLNPANSIRLTNLHTLSLTFVGLLFPDCGLPFLNQCPSLKTLTLYDCYGFATLSVISSSLETLSIIKKTTHFSNLDHLDIYCDTLKTLHIDLASHNQLLKTFKLSAPNVHTFTCSAVSLNCHILKPFNSLKDATIYIYIHVVNDWELVKNFGSQLLTHVNHAKVLRLCSQSLQILAGMMIAAPAFTLSNLEHLTLFTHMLNICDSSSIIYILQRSSNMKTLKISREYYYCVIQNAEVCNKIQQMEFVHHLKLVEMSLLGDGETNLKLLKYLFKTGTALEQITIFYDSLIDSNIAKRFDQKLSVIQKTSSSPLARLSFLPNQ